MKTINFDQFEESTVYSWAVCPECGHYNTQAKINAANTCKACGEEFFDIRENE